MWISLWALNTFIINVRDVFKLLLFYIEGPLLLLYTEYIPYFLGYINLTRRHHYHAFLFTSVHLGW